MRQINNEDWDAAICDHIESLKVPKKKTATGSMIHSNEVPLMSFNVGTMLPSMNKFSNLCNRVYGVIHNSENSGIASQLEFVTGRFSSQAVLRAPAV